MSSQPKLNRVESIDTSRGVKQLFEPFCGNIVTADNCNNRLNLSLKCRSPLSFEITNHFVVFDHNRKHTAGAKKKRSAGFRFVRNMRCSSASNPEAFAGVEAALEGSSCWNQLDVSVRPALNRYSVSTLRATVSPAAPACGRRLPASLLQFPSLFRLPHRRRRRRRRRRRFCRTRSHTLVPI
jgi:hypothetical protein